jgi:hypothetical protein
LTVIKINHALVENQTKTTNGIFGNISLGFLDINRVIVNMPVEKNN